MKSVKTLLVILLLFGLVIGRITTAATINPSWNSSVDTESGLVMVASETYESTLSILTSNGDPFTPSNFPTADIINVTAKFIDEYGNAIDMTGDGNPDVWTYVEDPNTHGLWKANITLGDIEPGIYTLKIEAIAKNSTTGEIFDQASIEEDVFILGGPYALQIFNVEDNQDFKLGTLDIHIGTISDIGSIISIGNFTNVRTIKDNNTDGVWGERIDLDNDGITDGWLTFIKNEDRYDMIIFSKNQTLLETLLPEREYRISGDGTVKYSNLPLRTTSNYRDFTYYAYMFWDESWLAKLGIKAVDYYLIPYSTSDNWKITAYSSGRILHAIMKVRIIRRTTYIWFITKEETIFDGNIWTRDTKTIDGIITLKPKVLVWSWYYRYGYGIIWRAYVDATIPNTYSIKQQKGYSVQFRGDNPLDGLNTISKLLSKDEIDWYSLLGGESDGS